MQSERAVVFVNRTDLENRMWRITERIYQQFVCCGCIINRLPPSQIT